MLVTILFIFASIIVVCLQRKREENWINLISILVAPYVILVFLNNFFIYKVGFYKINDNVLIMLICSFYLFYIGGIPFNIKSSFLNQEKENI